MTDGLSGEARPLCSAEAGGTTPPRFSWRASAVEKDGGQSLQSPCHTSRILCQCSAALGLSVTFAAVAIAWRTEFTRRALLVSRQQDSGEGLVDSGERIFDHAAKDIEVGGAREGDGEITTCAAPSQDCTGVQCCVGEGMQCYEKNETWAECLHTCKDDLWSCKELGNRTVCAQEGENCVLQQCCDGEGMQCYGKNESWGACALTCPDEDWNCTSLGKRVPVSGCSKPSENCAATKCCTVPGALCYEKNRTWSECLIACMPDVMQTEGWNCTELGPRTHQQCSWIGQSCVSSRRCCHPGLKCMQKNPLEAYCSDRSWGTVIGGSMNEFAVPGVDPAKARGASLFCFMVTLQFSTEDALLETARRLQSSIFACDAHFHANSWQSKRITWPNGWNSIGNSDVFIDAWRHVKENGDYKHYDWTVKVDPDAVFFPARLRDHLNALHAPKHFPIYLKNSYLDFGFLGAIEIFSKEAIDKYFDGDGLGDNDKHCLTELGASSGEDGFMKTCMDMLGVGFMTDYNLLESVPGKGCGDWGKVSFHPYKQVGQWEQCYYQASR